MKHADFNFHQHGFVGHLAEPDAGSDRAVPLIGLMYKSFGRYQKENLGYFAESEKEIIDWVKA